MSGSGCTGFSYFLLSFKKILFLFFIKVDRQVSRVYRDKCPEYPQSIIVHKIAKVVIYFSFG